MSDRANLTLTFEEYYLSHGKPHLRVDVQLEDVYGKAVLYIDGFNEKDEVVIAQEIALPAELLVSNMERKTRAT